MVIAQGKGRWELPWAKNNLTEKCHSWKASYALNSGTNWLDVMFGAWLYMETKKIGAEYLEFPNVVLEENGEDKMVRENKL